MDSYFFSFSTFEVRNNDPFCRHIKLYTFYYIYDRMHLNKSFCYTLKKMALNLGFVKQQFQLSIGQKVQLAYSTNDDSKIAFLAFGLIFFNNKTFDEVIQLHQSVAQHLLFHLHDCIQPIYSDTIIYNNRLFLIDHSQKKNNRHN